MSRDEIGEDIDLTSNIEAEVGTIHNVSVQFLRGVQSHEAGPQTSTPQLPWWLSEIFASAYPCWTCAGVCGIVPDLLEVRALHSQQATELQLTSASTIFSETTVRAYIKVWYLCLPSYVLEGFPVGSHIRFRDLRPSSWSNLHPSPQFAFVTPHLHPAV
jgi:hypothetical protein